MNKISILALVIAVIALGGYVFPHVAGSGLLGGVTNYDEVDATAIKIGGTNGNRVGPIMTSTCSLISDNFTVTASTTKAMDCAVTGVVSGDLTFAQLATSTAAGAGWEIVGASASSTSGYITVRVANNTGTSAVIPASLASSTQYFALHPLSTVPGI